MDEQSYVIRIYRRGKLPVPGSRTTDHRRRQDRVTLTGTIDVVEHGERRTFHDMEELWGILCRTTGKK
jgi:hypothetical protein